jgi:thermostable 8-oxoguanine DNA glycosylase
VLFRSKSARFFLLYSGRKDMRIAALDRHVLAWLRERGYKGVPKHTPASGSTYAKWEKVFLDEADKAGKKPAELDWEVWSSKARKQKARSQGRIPPRTPRS